MTTKKKHAGDGLCKRRPNGTWECRASFGLDAEGKRVRRSFYASTLAQAKAKRKDALDEYEDTQGKPVDPKLTVAQFIDQWFASKRPSLEVNTARYQRMLLDRYVVPVIGTVPLKQLDAMHVAKLTPYAEKAGLSPNTIRNVHALVRSMCQAAVDWDKLRKNVARTVKMPKAQDTEIRAVTPEQAQAILAAINRGRYTTALTISLGMGLRRGEVCGLKWEDVDFERGVLSVRRQVQRVKSDDPKERLIVKDLKTGDKSRRTLPMPSVVKDALLRYRAEREEAPWFDPNGMVFVNRWGGLFDPGNLYNALQDALEASGLERMRLHELRHAFGTLSRFAGVSEVTLARMMGHSSTRMTNKYGAVVDSMMVDAAIGMDGVLKRRGS